MNWPKSDAVWKADLSASRDGLLATDPDWDAKKNKTEKTRRNVMLYDLYFL